MKRKNYLLIIFIMMNFVLAMTATVFGGILDQVAESLGVSIASSGLLNTMYAYGAAFGVPITLIVFRHIERSKMLKIMLLLTIMTTFAIVFVQNFIMLLIVRLIMGISANSYGVLAISTVIALASKERQGRSLALLIMGNSLALVIGIPMTRLLSGAVDWRHIFWGLNILMIISLICFHLFLPKGDHESTKLVLKNEWQFFKDKKIFLIILFTLVMFINLGAFYVYITPYFLLMFSSAETYMTLILVMLGIASFTGNIIGGHVSDRIGYAKSMMLGSILQLLLMVLIFITNSNMWFNIGFAVLWLMSVWFTGLQLNNGMAHETHNKSSFMLSMIGSAIQLGSAIGSSLSAMVIANTGIQNIVIIAMVASGGIVVIQWISMTRHHVTRVSTEIE